MPLDRAVSTLQDDGLKAGIVTQPSDAPQGTVFRQDPTAGTEVDDGSTVQLLVSGGPSTEAVPNAVGLDEANARDRLVAAGFEVESREVFSEEKPGMVVSQQPAAGADAPDGASVTIAVSKGTGLVDVPNVVGLSRGEAEAEISSAKLEANVVEVPSTDPAGTVVAQNPVGGQAREGSTVRLNVSQG
jgi:serine/threonine-protein kinase